MTDVNLGNLHGGWTKVVHKGCGQALPVLIIGKLLVEAPAKAMGYTSHHLAFKQHRIEDSS